MSRRLIGALLLLLGLAAAPAAAQGCAGPAAICPQGAAGAMPLIEDGRPVMLIADGQLEPGVQRAFEDLQRDLARVSGGSVLGVEGAMRAPAAVIVGTLGRSPVIDALVREGRLDVSNVAGQWEGYVHQLVERPAPGIARALVIAGADKRGTIFGIYDLSQRIGVSPWHWWADVPVRRQAALWVHPGRRAEKPAVRYRGIFINDEEPALGNWARATFGGINARFYERVFELILRMRGNYLWPAMWGKSLWEDDPESARLANEMGVVLGTSHHEPMMRAHVDWERQSGGAWDYRTNAERLRQFWREGLERTRGHEQLVTVGMRGDGDEPMTQGTATELLETIVRDQRRIIEEASGRPAAETPQVWALYKEVQDYYDAGMRVPDDVTLLFADDNWGNVRRLPAPDAAPRAGGYGVYYHFDYVGGPRNYKWINTTQIERVWEQMHLSWRHGADRLWIVNVGDLKPMEFPTSFFLDYAWSPEEWPLERLAEYPEIWAARQFGEAHADRIGELLTRYSIYAARRKPELVSPETYSLTHHGEAERVVRDWRALAREAEETGRLLPDAQDAYFQLVLHPILANANLHELYVTVARNRLYAEQGRASANALAERARALYARHGELRTRYETLAGGKWRHMMSQAVIGYTGWQQPDAETMPEVRTVEPVAGAAMGVAPEDGAADALLAFDRFADQTRTVGIFNRGIERFRYEASSAAPWILLGPPLGEVIDDARLTVSIDWRRAPPGRHRAPILIRGSEGTSAQVMVETFNPPGRLSGFVESDGVVAIEAVHHARAVGANGINWRTIPNLGRTGSAVTAFPVTAPAQEPGRSPWLEYPIHLFEAGEIDIHTILSPTLDFRGREGLRYAVSIGDEPPQLVNVHAGTGEREWEEAVAQNAWIRTTRHRVSRPGAHVVRIWLVDPGLVFQRLHIARPGALPPSYLGPPESPRLP